VSDIGKAQDAQQIQTNVVRVDGQRSVYIPVLKQGGDTNTISIVAGIRAATAVGKLLDVPKELVTNVVFDQSQYVKTAIETLVHEGGIGLFLTSVMILVFLGSFRATLAVFFSIPLSALTAFLLLSLGGSSVNSMVLGGLALAFSRLIDNSVVVLENIHRHMEMGLPPAEAAEKGGREVALPVLAATLTAVVVFFPVTFLYGVSKYLFSALALAVVLSLFASYVVAMTVVPLFCARFLKVHAPASHDGSGGHAKPSLGQRFNNIFNAGFHQFLDAYDRMVARTLSAPLVVVLVVVGLFFGCVAMYPLLGISFFPRTDAGQFIINLKAPTGTRLEVTEENIKAVEDIARKIVSPEDLGIIVSNIGSTPDFSALYTPNSAQHTAFVQVSLTPEHRTGSYEYMNRMRAAIASQLPQLSAYFQSGGLVDAVLNMGLPAPIDVQVSGSNLERSYKTAVELSGQIRRIPGVSDVFIPQDVDYPALQLDIDRTKAAELGLNQREVVGNVITALTSNGMIAPSYWIDAKSGNDYMLTVQYPETQIKNIGDVNAIPVPGGGGLQPARLQAMSQISRVESPTEVDHYQLRRVTDIYVQPQGEDLGKIANQIDTIIAHAKIPEGLVVTLHGMVQGMRSSFTSFGIGLTLSVVLLFLILVAQFRSFTDPFLILLAFPPGLSGVILTLWLTGTTVNVMSLMGVVMLAGITMSDSILIVEFAKHLMEHGMPVRQAVITSCHVRLRPIVMTTLATIIGLLPMALKLGTGSESYAPLARALVGGLSVSGLCTVFVVPAAFLLAYRNKPVLQELND
jgi:multidrug efflux pump subunit AcrB